MPLHSDNPVGISGPFHGFNRAIGGIGGHLEFFPRLVNGLVMAAIDVSRRRTGKFYKKASGAQDRIVLLIAPDCSRGKIRGSMWNGLRPIRAYLGDILD